MASGHIDRIEQGGPKALHEHKKSVEQIKERTRAMVSGLLILTGGLIVLSNVGADFTVMWLLLGIIAIIALIFFLRQPALSGVPEERDVLTMMENRIL